MEEIDWDDLETTKGGWESYLFHAAAHLERPQGMYQTLAYRFIRSLKPNEWDNCSSTVKEIGVRALLAFAGYFHFWHALIPFVAGMVALQVGSKALRFAGCYLQKKGVTHIKGEPQNFTLPVSDGSLSLLSWNIQGHRIPYAKGGGAHWRSRIEEIAKEILEKNPDVIVLRGIEDDALVEWIVKKLSSRYAHFCTHMGAKTFHRGAQTMVITKSSSSARFLHKEFPQGGGFGVLEMPKGEKKYRFVCTELSPTDRKEQMRKIEDFLCNASLHPVPTFFVGHPGETTEEFSSLSFGAPLNMSKNGKGPDCIGLFKNIEGLKVVEKVSHSKKEVIQGFERQGEDLSAHHGEMVTIKAT